MKPLLLPLALAAALASTPASARTWGQLEFTDCDLAVSLLRLPSLGWTVILDAPGGAPIAAAPAPLRLLDAQTLAAAVVASRAGEPEPDRSGLANLLRRASHLVVDLGDRIARLDLPRVVIGGRGARTLVVDAYADLA